MSNNAFNQLLNQGRLDPSAVVIAPPVVVTDSAVVATPAAYAGRTVLLDRAAGIAVTLPAATGSGVSYKFLVKTSITSNSTTIKVANATDVMQGLAVVLGAAVAAFATGATADTITFNGSTTGGLFGTQVELVDVAAGFWSVIVHATGSGTAATVFSATV